MNFGFNHFKPTPFSLGLPFIWLEANDLDIGNGDGVDFWKDKSGNNRDFMQSTANARPLLNRPGFNGNATANFDTSNDSLVGVSAYTLTNPWAIFIAEFIPPNRGAGSNRTCNSTTRNALFSPGRTDTITSYNEATVSTVAVAPGRIAIGVLKTGPVNHEAWFNTNNYTAANVANADWGPLSFGAFGAFPESANTNLYEIIVYNRFVNSDERAMIEGYLMAKYGASKGLSG